MVSVFSLAVLGGIAILFLKAGGGDLVQSGFASLRDVTTRVDNIEKSRGTSLDRKAKDRQVEDA